MFFINKFSIHIPHTPKNVHMFSECVCVKQRTEFLFQVFCQREKFSGQWRSNWHANRCMSKLAVVFFSSNAYTFDKIIFNIVQNQMNVVSLFSWKERIAQANVQLLFDHTLVVLVTNAIFKCLRFQYVFVYLKREKEKGLKSPASIPNKNSG